MPTESALCHRAAREGFSLHKSRVRKSLDNLGGWMIVDPRYNVVVAGEHFNLSDEDVWRFLRRTRRRPGVGLRQKARAL